MTLSCIRNSAIWHLLFLLLTKGNTQNHSSP
nr:MAG TPA: hypothetical protein [Caudoviricetes sp.]DAR79798.1 MAG TPA: hypothetical protein [Caudoviricetes sp.]